jgi:dTDP-4-dehydrorhamnose reductase
MRVLITGGAGLLGSTLIARAPAGVELHATQRTRPVSGAAAHVIELSDQRATAALLREVAPDLVIHTAYSQSSPERDVWWATESLALACRDTGTPLVHLSSDVVFDGEHAPYSEDDEPAPVHLYGRMKAFAERFVRAQLPDAAIVRTSLIVREHPMDPASAWLVNALRCGEPVRLYVDELRCPISVVDLADQLWELALLPAERRASVWHLAGPEAVSRYTLGMFLAWWQGIDLNAVKPGYSRDSPAPRPRDLRLLTTRADRELRTRARPVSELFTDLEGDRPGSSAGEDAAAPGQSSST